MTESQAEGQPSCSHSQTFELLGIYGGTRNKILTIQLLGGGGLTKGQFGWKKSYREGLTMGGGICTARRKKQGKRDCFEWREGPAGSQSWLKGRFGGKNAENGSCLKERGAEEAGKGAAGRMWWGRTLHTSLKELGGIYWLEGHINVCLAGRGDKELRARKPRDCKKAAMGKGWIPYMY